MKNKNNIFIAFYLIFSIFFMQTNAYASSISPLFNSSKKVVKSVTIKKYSWDAANYNMTSTQSSHTDVANYTESTFNSEARSWLTSAQSNQKIVFEYEFDNFYDDTSVNYKTADQLTAATGVNKYTSLVNTSSVDGKNRNNNIDELRSNVAKAVVFTAVSNYGQKASTGVARSYLSEDGKKLIVKAEKVNYLDMFLNDIEDRCRLNLPIPKLMYSVMSTINLTSDTPSADLAATPGVISLEKDGSMCSKDRKAKGNRLMETSLFLPSGDLKLFFKDENWNKLIAASFTTDAIYFNDAIEATMVFDDPDASDVQEKKTKAKYFKLKQWFEFSTNTDWYRIVPIGMIHNDINFGSYSLADVNNQGTKIAGAWSQTSNVSGAKITPEGHSINFMIVPITKFNGNLIGNEVLSSNPSNLDQNSDVKKSWDIFTIIMIIAVIAIMYGGYSLLTAYGSSAPAVGATASAAGTGVGTIGSVSTLGSLTLATTAATTATTVGAELTTFNVIIVASAVSIAIASTIDQGLGTKSVGSVAETRLSSETSFISKLKYQTYITNYVNSAATNLYSSKPSAFFDGQNIASVYNAIDNNIGTSASGTLIHGMIGSIGLFKADQKKSISQRAAAGTTILSDSFLKFQTNFFNRMYIITPVINNILDFSSSSATWGLKTNADNSDVPTGTIDGVEGAEAPTPLNYNRF